MAAMGDPMDATANRQLLEKLYACFAARDGAGMAACYAPDATFSDPAFPGLKGREVGAMWTMLTSRAADLAITLDDVGADAGGGNARWTARYTFTATGRPVTNVVTSVFTFAGGKIATEVDHFDFWRWSRQALGPAGALLGWTPLLQKKVQKQARQNLDAFLARQPGAAT
jgi:ketosteroid isomerase-like protein